MVELIPSQDKIMQILQRTGAFREGHFVYPNGKHSAHYFQMPLAFRYYDTARVLAVALSRKFRLEKDISSQLPKVSESVRARAVFRSLSVFATRLTPNRSTGPNKSMANVSFVNM